MGLSGLAPELIDKIVGFVDLPQDLARLSQVSKFLHSAVVPDYLHWLAVRMKREDASVLHTLRDSPRLAHHVQFLRIETGAVDEAHLLRYHYYTPVVTSSSVGFPTEEDYSEAGRHLHDLQSLDVHIDALDGFIGFFTCLRVNRVKLREMRVLLPRVNPDSVGNEVAILGQMGGYTRFQWRSNDSHEKAITTALGAMLATRCPDLEEVAVQLPARLGLSLHETFWLSRWSRLRTADFGCFEVSDSMRDFLVHHPLLESFALHSANQWQPLALPNNALPRLSSIRLSVFNDMELLMSLVCPLPDGSRRPLRSLAIINGDNLQHCLPRFCREIFHIPSLKSLSWTCQSNDDRLGDLIPIGRAMGGLERLTLIPLYPLTVTSVDRLKQAIASFPSLRELCLDMDNFPEDYNHGSFVSAVTASCPNLVSVGNGPDPSHLLTQ